MNIAILGEGTLAEATYQAITESNEEALCASTC
jgi:hypothetical protein